MSIEQTQAVVSRWIEAYNRHDLDAVASLLADGYQELGPSGALSGKAAGLADTRDLFTSQPDVAMRVTATVVQDGVAAVEYVMTGTLLGPIHVADGRVVPPTNKRYDMSGCTLLWTDGALVTAAHHYYDRVLMREQLGLT